MRTSTSAVQSCGVLLATVAFLCVDPGCLRSGYDDGTCRDGSEGPSGGDAGEVVGAYRTAVLEDDPLAYFTLDDPPGSVRAIDISARGAYGAYLGTPGFGQLGALAAGSGTSVRFSGDDYVTSQLPEIDTAAGSRVSVELWMSWDGSHRKMPVAFGTYDLVLWDTGEFGFNTDQSEVWGVVRHDLAGRWVHVVAEFYNGDVRQSRMYIDGEEQSLSMVVGEPHDKSVCPEFLIGRYDSDEADGYKFTGLLDEVVVYNHPLAPARVLAHFEAAAQEP